MEKLDYPAYGRELYKTTLANGLKINLLPMPDYHKTYAILTTDFGSVDNTFVIDGQQQTVPNGVAHFLEHKLFEKADHDAFDLFGALGADANAFTSFTQTSYLFSTTAHLHESLDVLLDFVFDPYFTEQTVDKEKGIIGQEIRMYADSPDNRLYMGTLGNLYPEDPVKIDIAGSEDSIAKITPELLYQIHRTFYQPGNMNLFVVGNLDPDRVVEWVQANQTLANWPAAPLPVHTFAPVDPQANDVVPFVTLEMPVARPKAMIGLRGISDFESGQERLRFVQSIGMALELLFDDTSENYLRMYNEEVLDDSFGFGLEIERGFHFATFASETNRPEAFADAIIDILRRAPGELDAARDQFEAIKRGQVGRLVACLDSPEQIANRFSGHLFDQATIFDELASLESITFADLQNAVAQLIVPQRLSAFFVLPEGKQEV
ncbi:EF-P 5-aminopentanol modification-associated protein YfmH [Limosilactobacillus fermentum]|uniref:EF-P 5-aminopentanol modification-associated protein YfmH n=1 Tax=Limosilactobacillus fermentum TaxID=1613 RepID=UPI000F4EF162|nr:pitrilysin family protein [Limosilactobacillus fermentum]